MTNKKAQEHTFLKNGKVFYFEFMRKSEDNVCEECHKDDESVSQNLIMHGYKICNSCKNNMKSVQFL